MTHRIDAAMHAMKSSANNSPADRFMAEARTTQLSDRDHPVLSGGNFGHTRVGLGGFLAQYKG
jgi:ABC-type hemin transport system ATPase subunit